MKNGEKFKDKIKAGLIVADCDFVREQILKKRNCLNIRCGQCIQLQMDWIEKEYVAPEPDVDWTKIPVDTLILVKDKDYEHWQRRYFAKYSNGKVYGYCGGCTSWSAFSESDITGWNYAKLVRKED